MQLLRRLREATSAGAEGSALLPSLGKPTLALPQEKEAALSRRTDLGHDFTQVPVRSPTRSGGLRFIPQPADAVTTQPAADAIDSAGEAGYASEGCGTPLAMTKVTSGKLHGGYTIADYYPERASKHDWTNGAVAGPFDTGVWAGSKIQLYGTIPKFCESSDFTLAQTATCTRYRRNNIVQPEEGTSFDDLAGRNTARPPFRRIWTVVNKNISLADIPSLNYAGLQNAELEVRYDTALLGLAGFRSVQWNIVVIIRDGVVIKNTIS